METRQLIIYAYDRVRERDGRGDEGYQILALGGL